jgi:hypothetical protein
MEIIWPPKSNKYYLAFKKKLRDFGWLQGCDAAICIKSDTLYVTAPGLFCQGYCPLFERLSVVSEESHHQVHIHNGFCGRRGFLDQLTWAWIPLKPVTQNLHSLVNVRTPRTSVSQKGWLIGSVLCAGLDNDDVITERPFISINVSFLFGRPISPHSVNGVCTDPGWCICQAWGHQTT